MERTTLEHNLQILECLIAKYPVLWKFDDRIEDIKNEDEFESLRIEMLNHVINSDELFKGCCLLELNILFKNNSNKAYNSGNKLMDENFN